MQYIQRLARLRTTCWKRIVRWSTLANKEYLETFVRYRLWQFGCFCIFNDLIWLKKIFISFSMKASDHWSKTFTWAETRSNKKLFIKANTEDDYSNRTILSINFLSLLTNLPIYSHYKNPYQFKKSNKFSSKGRQKKIQVNNFRLKIELFGKCCYQIPKAINLESSDWALFDIATTKIFQKLNFLVGVIPHGKIRNCQTHTAETLNKLCNLWCVKGL